MTRAYVKMLYQSRDVVFTEKIEVSGEEFSHSHNDDVTEMCGVGLIWLCGVCRCKCGGHEGVQCFAVRYLALC